MKRMFLLLAILLAACGPAGQTVTLTPVPTATSSPTPLSPTPFAPEATPMVATSEYVPPLNPPEYKAAGGVFSDADLAPDTEAYYMSIYGVYTLASGPVDFYSENGLTAQEVYEIEMQAFAAEEGLQVFQSESPDKMQVVSFPLRDNGDGTWSMWRFATPGGAFAARPDIPSTADSEWVEIVVEGGIGLSWGEDGNPYVFRLNDKGEATAWFNAVESTTDKLVWKEIKANLDSFSDEQLIAYAPDLSGEGLTKVEEGVVYGLESQRYVKYVDSEGLVRKVFDSETAEVLLAGESVWNAKEKISGETIKFSCLVVTSKGTEENDGHLEINKDKLKECARTVAAVAAINHGKNVLPAFDPRPEAKYQLVKNLVDQLLADVVTARQKGELFKVRLGDSRTMVDPTQVVVRLNYDPEAKGIWMIADHGRRTNRLKYKENEERDLLQIVLSNANFGDSIDGFSRGEYFSWYVPHGWIYEGLIRMLKDKAWSGMTGDQGHFLLSPNSLYYAVLRFANSGVEDYIKLDYMWTDLVTDYHDDLPAERGDWFGGDFVKNK